MKKTSKSAANAPPRPEPTDKWQKREDADVLMRHAELVKDRSRFREAMSHVKQVIKINDKKK